MKTFAALFCAFLVAGLALPAHAAGKLQHVVCFKFKSTATSEQIKQVEDAFQALKTKVPQIDKLKWGTNISKEQRDKGFTHCFIVTFKNAKARDIYLEHPDHKAFGKLVGPLLEDVFVIDIVGKK